MLGEEGWKPSAQEAREVGLVREVVEHDQLLARWGGVVFLVECPTLLNC